ncbi:MAG TPA: cell envelope integrity protein CreD [Salinimicrobium sp.]|nr:cell envelope integrity protein CreD [Salinimicrobium sp.]
MKNLKSNIFFKISIIFILILILLIPTSMVKNLIYEREFVQENAIQEVSSKWANGQTITGPYISIPFDKYVRQFSKKDSTEKLVKYKDWLYILPDKLEIAGSINPEKRYRGIYEVVVYESNFKLSGVFTPINLKKFEIEEQNIHFDKATLNIGISDLRGIEKQIVLNWNDKEIFFNSGTSTRDITSSGINSPIPVVKDSTAYHFSMNVDLKGSQNLYFVPVGKTTDVEMKSNWTTPSFTGNYLPDDRNVTEEGFTANWNVLHLNRNYPQSWIGSAHNVQESTFGTDLLLPVDNYKKSYRVAEYAILFLALTFMVFFFVEVLNKVFIHPIQYLLVGIALIVFYTLLLSFSEHIKFNLAYILSAILTLVLITSYTAAILKSKKVGLLIFGILFILYSFIFTIIQLEDYALLIGSIGVFVILGIVMYFSRKIDWYNIRLGENAEKPKESENK